MMLDTHTKPVLILDADLPPALTIARSLHRKGVQVEVASHESCPLAGYSRTVAVKHRYPDPLEHEFDFIEWVAERLASECYSLIVPVTERTVTPLLRHRQGLTDARLAMAPSDALAVVLDKSRTMALATQLGIPTPSGHTVTDLAELGPLEPELRYPVVVKPVSSVGSNKSRNVQLTVSYAENRNELETLCAHALHHGAALLQEHFSGDGVGIELIADHGKVVYAFQHLRQHEVPLTGGGSSLRMSVPITPALLDASQKLMAALGWHGVAMVEFKHRADTGEFRLMEINGRFWGSLPLAVEAGADFPAMLYELLVEGRVGEWPPYRHPVYCRNLARDVAWHELVLRREAPGGLVKLPSGRQVLHDLALGLSLRHRFDVQKWNDPWPGLVDLSRIFRSYAGRLAGQFKERAELSRQRRVWTNGTVAQQLKDSKNLLFLCYGNINRSAVAEVYARRRLDSSVAVDSAGFHHEAGRPADATMTEVAAEVGVDMLEWCSKTLTAAMIEKADAIFVMELAHRRRLLQAFPETEGRVFLLGMGSSRTAAGGEIADPYGKSRSHYETALNQVTNAVDAIAETLRTCR